MPIKTGSPFVRLNLTCECGSNVRVDCEAAAAGETEKFPCPKCNRPLPRTGHPLPGRPIRIFYTNAVGNWIKVSGD